ncbi:KGG domain-containing protein [Mesorhizobium sp.]|uniref:KGG domain-containing protein n=1 Tax=Mesorhizobium sp. TaxID=1871066 RepID=UPI0026A40867
MANQGGSHEQHVKAGQQSHKNRDQDQRPSGGQQNADDMNKRRGGQQQAEDMNKGRAGQQGGDMERGQHAGGQHRGGSGNFAEDRERASQAGRKGGQS